MRLIDAEHLIDCINVVQEMALAIGGKLEAIEPVNEGFISLINSQPTIEAEPVKHGRWKEYDDDYGDTYECTSCGELFCMIEGTPIENGYDYCPKCGAKMYEEKEE